MASHIGEGEANKVASYGSEFLVSLDRQDRVRSLACLVTHCEKAPGVDISSGVKRASERTSALLLPRLVLYNILMNVRTIQEEVNVFIGFLFI